MAEFREGIPDAINKENEDDFEVPDHFTPAQRIAKLSSAEVARYRLLAIKEMTTLSNILPSEEVRLSFTPILKELVLDQEPVVRQGVAENLGEIGEGYGRQQSTSPAEVTEFAISLSQLCEKLLSDIDTQVRENSIDSYIALCALIRIKNSPSSPPSSLSPLSLSSLSSSSLSPPNSPTSCVLTPSPDPSLPLSLPPSLSKSLSLSLKSPLSFSVSSFFEGNVVQLIRKFAETNDVEDHVTGANILKNSAPILGKELVLSLLPTIEQFSKHNTFRVRQIVASGLGFFAEVLGQRLSIDSLLPLFDTLSTDTIWRVREACVSSIVSLSNILPTETSCSVLIPKYEEFVDDNSRWVRTAAYKKIGPFIATFESEHVTESFLSIYTDMISPQYKNKVGEPFISEYCSFSFPGVLLTIGPDRWDSLKGCYQTLAKDPQWKVRRSLSHSLHDVAKIVGPEITVKELIDCFNQFFTDLDLVRIGVIKHFSSFLEVVPQENREQFLSSLKETEEEEENWRYRKYIAQQLAKLSELVPSWIESFLFPCSLRLAFDPVSSVRRHAVGQIGLIAAKLDSNASEKLVETLLDKSQPPSSCYERQIFVDVCGSLIEQTEVSFFEKYFLSTFLNLSKDPVPNVRLGVAEVLARKVKGNPKWKAHQPKITKILDKLEKDSDVDVSAMAKLPSSF